MHCIECRTLVYVRYRGCQTPLYVYCIECHTPLHNRSTTCQTPFHVLRIRIKCIKTYRKHETMISQTTPKHRGRHPTKSTSKSLIRRSRREYRVGVVESNCYSKALKMLLVELTALLASATSESVRCYSTRSERVLLRGARMQIVMHGASQFE